VSEEGCAFSRFRKRGVKRGGETPEEEGGESEGRNEKRKTTVCAGIKEKGMLSIGRSR